MQGTVANPETSLTAGDTGVALGSWAPGAAGSERRPPPEAAPCPRVRQARGRGDGARVKEPEGVEEEIAAGSGWIAFPEARWRGRSWSGPGCSAAMNRRDPPSGDDRFEREAGRSDRQSRGRRESGTAGRSHRFMGTCSSDQDFSRDGPWPRTRGRARPGEGVAGEVWRAGTGRAELPAPAEIAEAGSQGGFRRA